MQQDEKKHKRNQRQQQNLTNVNLMHTVVRYRHYKRSLLLITINTISMKHVIEKIKDL